MVNGDLDLESNDPVAMPKSANSKVFKVCRLEDGGTNGLMVASVSTPESKENADTP